MRNWWIALVVLAATTAARADNTSVAIEQLSRVSGVDRSWPAEPLVAPSSPMAMRAADLGSAFLARHVPALTFDLVDLQLDALHGRAQLNVGGGNAHYAMLRVSSAVEMVDDAARVSPRVAVAIADHTLDVRLPDVEVAQAHYRDERGFELRLPIVHRNF